MAPPDPPTAGTGARRAGCRRAACAVEAEPRPSSRRRKSAASCRRILDRRPYLKYAFTNPYNLSLFLGTLAAAGLTLNPFLAVAAVGLEALWLLHAPDSKRLRHLLWDPRFEKVREALLAQERAAADGVARRARPGAGEALVARQKEIRPLAGRTRRSPASCSAPSWSRPTGWWRPSSTWR